LRVIGRLYERVGTDIHWKCQTFMRNGWQWWRRESEELAVNNAALLPLLASGFGGQRPEADSRSEDQMVVNLVQSAKESANNRVGHGLLL
jgi:hypothetical protein